MTDRLLTAREVAELLGVSSESVLRWTRRGELPAIRLPGGAIRFSEDALGAWLEERATPRRGVLTTTADAARLRTVPLTALTTTEDEEDQMPAIQRGQAYRLGPNRWGLRYYDDAGARRRKSSFPSKSAALAYFRDVIEPEIRGNAPPAPEITLAEGRRWRVTLEVNDLDRKDPTYRGGRTI